MKQISFAYNYHSLLYYRLILKQIDKSISEYEKSKDDSKLGEESVLQKLLKIDRHYANIMTFDMLMAGIDTV